MEASEVRFWAKVGVEADVLARLRSFVAKLRAEYPAQVGEK